MKFIVGFILSLSLSSFAFAKASTTATSDTVGTLEATTAGNAEAQTELAAPLVPSTSQLTGENSIVSKAEKDIAVQLEPVKKEQAAEGSMKLIMGLGVLGILAAGGIFLVNKYRRANLNPSVAPEIKILRQHHLGPKKSLAIIRVAGESILIGVTDHNINMIKSLSLLDDDVPEETPVGFGNVMQRFAPPANEGASSGNSGNATRSAQTEEGEDFSISGIKDFVSSRLKNMRNLE